MTPAFAVANASANAKEETTLPDPKTGAGDAGGVPANPKAGLEIQGRGDHGILGGHGAPVISEEAPAGGQPPAPHGTLPPIPNPPPPPAPAAPAPGDERQGHDAKTAGPTAFEIIWEAYPRKMGKKKAREAWNRIKTKPPTQQVLEAIATWKAHPDWTKKGGQFIP
jgi:hypothetical protein